jgi:hypothetical protein
VQLTYANKKWKIHPEAKPGEFAANELEWMKYCNCAFIPTFIYGRETIFISVHPGVSGIKLENFKEREGKRWDHF